MVTVCAESTWIGELESPGWNQNYSNEISECLHLPPGQIILTSSQIKRQ